MKNLNQKIRWMLMALPLAGCATSVPLTSVANNESATNQTKVVSRVGESGYSYGQVKPEVKVKAVGSPVSNLYPASPSSSDSSALTVNPLGLPGNAQALAAQKPIVGKPMNVDPNVKLIAPPTGLPRTNYVVPQVEEKENFVPVARSTSRTKAKTTVCSKGKNGKKVCSVKKVVVKKDSATKGKTSVKARKPVKTSGKNTPKKASQVSKKKDDKKAVKKK